MYPQDFSPNLSSPHAAGPKALPFPGVPRVITAVQLPWLLPPSSATPVYHHLRSLWLLPLTYNLFTKCFLVFDFTYSAPLLISRSKLCGVTLSPYSLPCSPLIIPTRSEKQSVLCLTQQTLPTLLTTSSKLSSQFCNSAQLVRDLSARSQGHLSSQSHVLSLAHLLENS